MFNIIFMETFTECILCTEPIEHTVLLPCGHAPMCMKCYLTLQQCYKENQCPVCQNEIVPGPIITDKKLPFNYEDEKKENYRFDEKLKYFYKETSIKEEMDSYLKYQCSECGQYFTNRKKFTEHLSTHKVCLCNVCSRSGRFLNIDVPIFSKPDLKKHLKQHPRCLVCPYQAFDAHDLGVHMNENHVRCNLCAKKDKILWFATAEDVMKHNREYHYICEHPNCINLPSNAYSNSIELQFHQLSVHKSKIPSTIKPKFDEEIESDDNAQIEREANKRHIEACKRLALKANDEFRGNKKRVGKLLSNIDSLDEYRITPEQFIKQYHSICGKSSEFLFCDTVSAVGDSEMRALLVRLQEGYRLGKVNDTGLSNEEFPSLV